MILLFLAINQVIETKKFQVLMYAMFVTIMIRVHTFPLFVIRPMYLALRQFQKTLVDVIKSRKATYNMRERYPDATPEEINSGDNTCIICREVCD